MKKLLVGLLICSLALTAQAALDKTVKFSFFNNSGGLNNKLSPIVIEDNEASDLQNVNFTLGGAIRKRNGYSSDNNAFVAGSTTGMYQYNLADGDSFLIVTGGDKIYKYDDFDGTPDDITGGVTIASNSSVLFDFTTANDVLLATNQTNPVKTWDGGAGTVSDLAAAPQGKYIEFHKNIVFIANTSANPSRIQFSNIADEETWTSTDWIDISANDGTEITGLVVLLDTLYIFKNDSIYRLSGTNRDEFSLARMVTDVGCISNGSIQVINNKIIFQARDGFYLYDGGINVVKISTKIEDTLDNLNSSRNGLSVSANFKRKEQYWVSVSSGASSQNDTILIFDYFHNAWTRYDGIQSHSMAIVSDATDKEQLYTGDFDLGAIYLQDIGDNDNGGAIEAYYQTKWFRFPELQKSDKVLRLIRVFVEEEGDWDLVIEGKQDFMSSTVSETLTLTGEAAVYGTDIYGTGLYGGDQVIVGRFPVTLRKNFFQLKFENNNSNEPFSILGYEVFIEESSRI